MNEQSENSDDTKRNQLVKAWTCAKVHLCAFFAKMMIVKQSFADVKHFLFTRKSIRLQKKHDTKILARLSEGDTTAIEARYYCKCLLSYYIKASSITSPQMQHDLKIICGIVFQADFFVYAAYCWFSVYFWKNNQFWKNEALFKLMVLVLIYAILLFLSQIKKWCIVYVIILVFYIIANLVPSPIIRHPRKEIFKK